MSRTPKSPQLFGNIRPSAPGAARGSNKKNPPPVPLPAPIPAPGGLHLDLAQLIDAKEIAAITAANKIVFHMVGDTGGVRDGAAQQTLVAEAMEKDFTSNVADNPAFFFHLGDVIYYNFDDDSTLPTQFLKPYQFLQEPIIAIPGNHDSSTPSLASPGNLAEFMRLFCTAAAKPIAPDFDRTTMIQPYIYFTLEAPFVKIIALYSNNGEGPGVLDPNGDQHQLDFLTAEFKRAAGSRPADPRPVIVAVHHPLFSISNDHGSSPDMLTKVDAVMDATGFVPDAFLSGHVHGFEFFVRNYKGREIPYVICGTGGYNDDAHVNQKPRMPAPMGNGFTLVQFFDFQYGYMRMTVDGGSITGEFLGVPTGSQSAGYVEVLETFRVNLTAHTVGNH